VYTGADGRAYRLERLEKKPDGYTRIGKNMLRYYPNGFYEIEREDDAYFYVRQYLPVKVEPKKVAVAEIAPLSPPVSEEFSWHEFGKDLPRSGQWRDNFAVADINGDGFPDLIFTPARKTLTNPVVFLGDGKGKWTPWKAAQYPALSFDYGGAAVGDFNGDGKPDIALGIHLSGVTVLTGDGKGKFSDFSTGLPRKKSGERPSFSSRKVFAYDWNGDGKTGLIALNERLGADPGGTHDGAVVFVNHDGTWTTAANDAPLREAVLMAVDASGKKLALADAPTSAGSVRISERKSGVWAIHDIAGFAPDALLTALAVTDEADVAGNSVFVIAHRRHVQSNWWTQIDLVSLHGDQWQRTPLSAQRDVSGVAAVAFGKLRKGTFRDIVMLDESGETSILRQTGATSYTHDHGLPTPAWRAGCQGAGLQTVDLDKDGIDEIVVSFAGEGTALTKSTECISGGAIQAFKISSAH
jgi:hypothetical protein